jgi:uncharacterized membrane protein YbhN (UPF0104 family)
MRGALLLAIKIVVSAALLYLSLRNTNFAALGERVGRNSLGWIAGWMLLAALITTAQVFLAGLRWREIAARCAAPLSTTQSFRYNLIGIFFNQTLPSSIGGDAMRLWLVKRTGAGWRAATYSVFVDRAIGLIALALVVIVSLPWSFQLIDNPRGRTVLVLIDLAALAAGAGFLVLGRLPWKWLKTWWPTHHAHACSRVANQVLFDRKVGAPVVLASILIHVMTAAVAWCGVRAISAPVDFGQVFLLIPPVVLITMLPISIAGWGLREATMMYAFGFAGLAPADGTMVSLLFGASSFLVGAVGGLVWIFSAEHASKVPDEVRQLS